MKPQKLFGAMLVAMLALFPCWSKAGETSRTFAHPDRIRYDSQCLTIDGKDVFIYSGAFHYFRCPKPLWVDRFQKIKAAGFNCVETYVPWNWHERAMPAGFNDFSKVDLTDLEDFLKLAESFGLYVILRPGPYICAEWDGGGYPQWLMTKKPAQPLRSEIWLRTDDPVYLDWCRHWYDAVCPVIAKHQITRKSPGQPGVILFQIENEYDFVKPKLSEEIMRNQLRVLAECARTNGIDVPLFTCVTYAVRGADDPLLRQVFDANNFYPLWKVDETQGKIEQLRREQQDAPLATTELQGGWFAKIGGKLSAEQDGITAAQINNLTLFMLQNGETILNYYMIFGGTNPGDWAARNMISSYDYNAPIRECGGVGDRYQRVQAIGKMLREHGAQLTRSVTVPAESHTSQNDVTVVERRAADGGRFFFVRTSQHTEPRTGVAVVKEKSGDAPEIKFAYDLEPFGSKILYLPSGVSDLAQGEWLPKPEPAILRPTNLPPAVKISIARMQTDPGPERWQPLRSGEDLASAGIYDSRFIFYQATVNCTNPMNVAVEYPSGDAVLAEFNGKGVSRCEGDSSHSIYKLPAGKSTVRFLYENHGHDNGHVAMENSRGVLAAELFGSDVKRAKSNDTNSVILTHTNTAGAIPQPLLLGEPRGTEQEWWQPKWDHGKWLKASVSESRTAKDSAQLIWWRMNFELPAPMAGVWVPWQLHLEASGNGFLFLNGHAIGRYWQAGPQRDFFLPECWLNFGPGKTNDLTLSLRPLEQGARIHAAVVEPYAKFAEYR
jgi:hypothetical protein